MPAGTVATGAPSRRTVYPATPTASDDAVQNRSAAVGDTARAATPVGTDGAVVSGGGGGGAGCRHATVPESVKAPSVLA